MRKFLSKSQYFMRSTRVHRPTYSGKRKFRINWKNWMEATFSFSYSGGINISRGTNATFVFGKGWPLIDEVRFCANSIEWKQHNLQTVTSKKTPWKLIGCNHFAQKHLAINIYGNLATMACYYYWFTTLANKQILKPVI